MSKLDDIIDTLEKNITNNVMKYIETRQMPEAHETMNLKQELKTLMLSLTVFAHTSDNDDELLARIVERIEAL